MIGREAEMRGSMLNNRFFPTMPFHYPNLPPTFPKLPPHYLLTTQNVPLTVLPLFQLATSFHSYTFPNFPAHYSPTFPSSLPSQQEINSYEIATFFH